MPVSCRRPGTTHPQLHIMPRNITKRIDRLETLILALSREADFIHQAIAPLLHLERRAYRKALGGAVSGLETARIVLVKARQRIAQRD
jgi:hypothetical protein